MSLSSSIESLFKGLGFEQVGLTPLTIPITMSYYESWLDEEMHGEMQYLRAHVEAKREPSQLLKAARTAIVVSKNYVPHPEPVEFPIQSLANIAKYARGRDYHHFLKRDLSRAIEHLQKQFPDEQFLCFTDSAPVLERDLASRAGLGWVGKNTCLLSKSEGSLFFIAEIYTTLEIPFAGVVSADFCGTCTRCLDACPTQAIVTPRKLDARKCISYLTIESRETPPESLRPQMGDWLFGCDVCQTVCPWNLRLERLASRPVTDVKTSRDALLNDLRFILTSTNRGLEKAFAGTALSRGGAFGLKRNALVVAGNTMAHELIEVIKTYLDHPRLGELARWAIKVIHGEGSRPQ